MKGIMHVLWMLCLMCLQLAKPEPLEESRRPIWNVAHMVNALYQADYYLDSGANSLEFDVTFDWEGTAKYTFHGVPCDCFRSCIRYERFVTYLDYMRQLTTPGHQKFRKNFIMLFMDIKVNGLSPGSRSRAGEDVAKKLIEHYWVGGTSGARAYILVSLPSINHIDFLLSFRRVIQKANSSFYESRIGFDFSGNENLDNIQGVLEGLKISENIWQGDGITNCLPRGTARLKDALYRRDQPGSKFIDKVYWWTVDKMSTMRTTLRMGVDGMITNYPDRLISVLKEDEFAGKLKLATYEDNPWRKHPRRTESLITWTHQARGRSVTNESFMTDDEEDLLYNC